MVNIRIYNRALSASEIQDLYLDGTSSTSVSNNTNIPYSNSYFSTNPTATYFPNS